ncbi:hypothetical protein GCM10027168_35120 [Streptomyces capparidis]
MGERGTSARTTAATAHRDTMDRLRELGDRLEAEYGPVTEQEMRAALDRIAAIDAWHARRRGPEPAA